jgi:hypothetical protein
MSNAKYTFNTQSLTYERTRPSIWKRILGVMAFIASAVVFASVIVLIAYSYFDSPKEKQLKREIRQLTLQYELLNKRMGTINAVLQDLQDRDDNIYRVIFEADPIPNEIRSGGYGGANKYKALEGFNNSELLVETTKKLDKLTKKLYIQSKSYDEIFKLVKDKSTMMAAIPAIQPISNKKLTSVASGFGMRMHPIYKTAKMHQGMDFTAPVGTPIYATGNCRVKSVEHDIKGYGKHLLLSHGYGYETLYAHMSRITVRAGQKVSRGELIGYVGNTGATTGPHLHYEVIKDGKKINPINFYYDDLTPEEYDKVVQIASQYNQSFD